MNWKFWQKKETPTGSRYFAAPLVLSEAQRDRRNLERLMSLAGMGQSAVWQTALSYADEHAANEQEAALRPDLTDSVRQYNAGRAACALDFACALRDLQAEAERQAAKLKADHD